VVVVVSGVLEQEINIDATIESDEQSMIAFFMT